ncbi:nitroreductase family deazaflavin-dependent oxidoreductase [Nocardia yamanashiensis]|uniref:nitroreductase family deazaflavin-dependent oxidoreductase n=1 Tax=Nocardia yamanashiensis TaxID=209247 RepID=UPI001E3EDC32|nr:nitroreductase family deazaflavin-dependent oxidoreductase [Nocardia yamanashiensis]UGT42093.1 nitroreductase family deazaflavin-dependent oxidoreductase [Nocardia yamanashiensis]
MSTAQLGARLLRTRWFVRAPIGLFRARLGFLFAGRLLLLEHLGRKSGRPRYVVLETVARPAPETVIIASGFGPAAQWYRNLRAHPACRVSIGFRNHVPATARTLTAEESKSVLAEYRRAHPAAYRELSGVIEQATGVGIDEVPLIELTLAR